MIQDEGPQVKLVLESSSVPSPDLKDHLDYNSPDDEIVGFLYQYKQQHPETDVRLLTHDTGPMMTARGLDLPFVKIKDTWLLPPESNEIERENRRLKEEIARLKKTEPQFQVKCVDDNGKEVTSLEIKHQVYEPLSEDDIAAFIDSLRNQFPLTTDFSPRESPNRELRSLNPSGQSVLMEMGIVYKPASEEKIAKYRDKKYPAWINECENIFSSLHAALQRKVEPPSFRFVAANEGTRPGKDALMDIKVKGTFLICPPQIEGKKNF